MLSVTFMWVSVPLVRGGILPWPRYVYLATRGAPDKTSPTYVTFPRRCAPAPSPPPYFFSRQIFSLQELAGDVLTVMRLRLKRFLVFLEASPGSSRGLLANLDADTCQWVRAAKDPEAVSRAQQSEQGQGEPLRSTHGVLLCLARALPRDSRHKVRYIELTAVVIRFGGIIYSFFVAIGESSCESVRVTHWRASTVVRSRIYSMMFLLSVKKC